MNFSKAFRLKPKDVVAIIGSGGKTSLCYKLANENIDKKTALTTTTKIYPITPKDIQVEENFFNYYGKPLPNFLSVGVSVFGKFCKLDALKITSLDRDEMELLKGKSDIFIYEADGSKQKPLKAWSEYEPVILENSTKVIGVIPLCVVGKTVDERIIHRFELFCKRFDVKGGQKITIELLAKIIDEMLQKIPSNAKKILFLNHMVNEKEYNLSWQIAKKNFRC